MTGRTSEGGVLLWPYEQTEDYPGQDNNDDYIILFHSQLNITTKVGGLYSFSSGILAAARGFGLMTSVLALFLSVKCEAAF